MGFVQIKLTTETAEKLNKIRNHLKAVRGKMPSMTDAVTTLIQHTHSDLESGKLTQKEIAAKERVSA